MRFWLEMGVDAFRLDAVPYLVEREGTNCENLPETHAVLKELRRKLDEEFPGGCCWRKLISGPRIFAHISVTEMNSTWHFIFR